MDTFLDNLFVHLHDSKRTRRSTKNYYTDNTVLMADSKVKLKELLENVVYEREKKRNYKTICMFVSKMNSSSCEGDIKIKRVKKYNYLGSVVRDKGKCDTKSLKCIRIAKYTFLKLRKCP